MAQALRAANEPEEPIEGVVDAEVDVDLDAQDEALRAESVGEPTTVRLKGKIFHIAHAGDWSSAAMKAASGGDWDGWAVEVLPDNEYPDWDELNLKNYQIEAVFSKCGEKAAMNLGKSTRQSGSRRSSRRR